MKLPPLLDAADFPAIPFGRGRIYFDKSEECRKAAIKSSDPDARRFWLTLAASYMHLAERDLQNREKADPR